MLVISRDQAGPHTHTLQKHALHHDWHAVGSCIDSHVAETITILENKFCKDVVLSGSADRPTCLPGRYAEKPNVACMYIYNVRMLVVMVDILINKKM